MNGQNQVFQKQVSAVHPAHGVKIPDERRTPWAQMLRFLSWLLLLTVSFASVGGALISLWYLGLTLEEGWAWFKDAQTPPLLDATRQFAVERNHDMVLAQWERYLVAIDLSGFTWIILLTASVLVAVRGLRHTLVLPLSQRGRGYWLHAFDAPRFELIPPGWAKFWVRCGLLGNLISFFLVAVFLMQNMPTSPESHGSPPQAMASAKQSDDGSTENSAVVGAKESPGAAKKGKGLEMNSLQFTVGIFLALCAALVSTLVGVLMAYVVAPVLNSLNDRALGLAQLDEIEVVDPMEQFQTRIALAAQAVVSFQTTLQQLTALFGALPMLESSLRMFQGDIKTLGTDLKTLIEQARQVPAVVKSNVSELVAGQKRLRDAVEDSTTLVRTQCVSVGSEVSALVRKLEPLSALPKTVGETADRFGKLCDKVSPVMLPAKSLIEELSQLVKSSGDTITSQTKVAYGVERLQTSQLNLTAEISSLLGSMEKWQNSFKAHLDDEQRKNDGLSQRMDAMADEMAGLDKKIKDVVTNHESNGSTPRTKLLTWLRHPFSR